MTIDRSIRLDLDMSGATPFHSREDIGRQDPGRREAHPATEDHEQLSEDAKALRAMLSEHRAEPRLPAPPPPARELRPFDLFGNGASQAKEPAPTPEAMTPGTPEHAEPRLAASRFAHQDLPESRPDAYRHLPQEHPDGVSAATGDHEPPISGQSSVVDLGATLATMARHLLVDQGHHGHRAVQIQLEDDVLPGVVLKVFEDEGRTIAQFTCAQEAPRMRLAQNAQWLADNLASKLTCAVLVRVLADNPQDPDLVEVSAGA